MITIFLLISILLIRDSNLYTKLIKGHIQFLLIVIVKQSFFYTKLFADIL